MFFLDRIPILSWKNPAHGATITRSSQPKVGFITNRSVSDENYLRAIVKTNPGKRLFLMDARPKVNAYANKGTGGGSETAEFYEDVELEYLGIGIFFFFSF